VAGDPQDLEFVEALLKSLQKRLATEPAADDLEHGLPESLRVAWQSKDWDKVRLQAPDVLVTDPGSVPALRALAEASAAQGRYDIELRYLEAAGQIAPELVELNRYRAKSLLRQGKYEEAIACWGRVQDATPEDAEAATMLAQLAIDQSRERHGLETSIQRRTSPRSAKAAAEPGLKPIVYQDERMLRDLFRQAAEHKRLPIQQLEQAVRDHPSHPDLYLKLASMYMEKGRDYDAEKLLAKAKDLCDDSRVAEYWEDVTMIRLDRKLAAAQKHLEVEPGEPAQVALNDARKARDRFQTEVFLNRCKREPYNPELRYQLGMRHKRAGKMREAYESFVVALDDEAYKGLAALQMAECLGEAQRVVEALQYYRIASEAARPDQAECKKQALYQAGLLADGMRLHRLAQRYRDRLHRIDPDYADRAESEAAESQGVA
jgi:tetratricopeptide (TPR) repeat protein